MKMTKFFLAFFMGLLLLAPLHQADSQTVDIPDANLRAAIEEALGLSAGDPIIETAMAGLMELDASGREVKDLTGLQYATGLTSLDLSGNPITDISILTTVNFPNLVYLDLTDTWVRDFSAIDGDYWIRRFNEDRDFDGNRLFICSNALENWDYGGHHNDIALAGAPLGKLDPDTFDWVDLEDLTDEDKARVTEQLNKPTCGPVFSIQSTGDDTSVRLVIDADSDLAGTRGSIGYVYRYRKSGDSWPSGGSETGVTPLWTGGFANPPPGEDAEPGYQGVIERQNGEYAVGITGLDPSAVYHFQVFGSFSTPGGTNRQIYPPGSEIQCWSTSEQSVQDCPPPQDPRTDNPHGLRVSFEDYPEEKPTNEFTLIIRFSAPVTGFRADDITIETERKTGSGDATLESLTPTGPARIYTATIQLPSRTTGTLKLIVRARAARSTTSEATGPATATASEPIDFGRRRVYLYPSPVAMDTIIFNEFRNATDDKNDWVELKNISDEPVALKEWEISLVVPHAISSVASNVERAANDRDVVEFPDYTLPPGGILLIVNTDPSENDLIHGQNIAHPHHNPDLLPQYLIAPEMRLPDTPYLLILRSAREKNGAWDGFEDLLGNYHKGDVSYRTQIWPLRDTWVYTGTGAHLSDAEVYERVMIERVTSLSFRARRVPEKRGYLRGAWVPSEVHSGLGYRPGVSLDTALGTPGYPTPMASSETGTGDISISEVMFATNERGTPAQWIELYNASTTEIVNLEGYQVRIEIRDHQPVHRHITFPLKSLKILPRQTVLLVSRKDRASENIPARQIYDAQRQLRRSPLLRAEGFSVRLLSPDETLVDRVGNLDGKVGRDTPRWALPSGFTETGKRSSMIRRYEDGIPWQGTVPGGWVRAAETSLLGPYTYYGLPTDNGTPGYRQGSPLPVTLSSFRADCQEGGVVVTWTTASEMENAGFHVLRRRDQASDFVQINPTLILGAGTTAERQTYTYRDTTAEANVPYRYRLEEVSLSGERRVFVATVRMRGYVSAANKVLWKWAAVKKSD